MFNRFTNDVLKDARRVTAVLSDPSSQQSVAQAAIEQMMRNAAKAEPVKRNAAVGILAESIGTLPLSRASLLSVVTGALIEDGADPTPAADPILARTYEALTAAIPYVEACRVAAKAAPIPVHEHSDDDDDEDDDEDEHRTVVERFGDEVASAMPDSVDAYGTLEHYEAASVAVLSRSKEARKRAHADTALRDAVQTLGDDANVSWLSQILSVLDDEEMVVLHPELKRGYLIRISGIGLNFQLHTLLADALIGDPAKGWLPGDRPDPRVAALARNAPYGGEELPSSQGAFNLVNWYGLQPDETLPDGMATTNAWIWNEGVPDDIAPFEGTRVILLTPPPYARSWNSGRAFPGMDAELDVVRQLAPDEVQSWLARIAAAPKPA